MSVSSSRPNQLTEASFSCSWEGGREGGGGKCLTARPFSCSGSTCKFSRTFEGKEIDRGDQNHQLLDFDCSAFHCCSSLSSRACFLACRVPSSSSALYCTGRVTYYPTVEWVWPWHVATSLGASTSSIARSDRGIKAVTKIQSYQDT